MTPPKRKDIPLSLQTLEPIEYTVDQLKVMLEVSRLQCEDLLHALRQVRNNKAVTSLIPLLTRVIRERNELEEQRFMAVCQFQSLNREFQYCKNLTEHFVIHTPN